MNAKKIQLKTGRYLILLFIILASTKTYAQEENKADVANVTKVTFLNPGISQEIKIGKHQTLYGQVFINTSATARTDYYNNTQNIDIDLYFDPAVTVQFRNYYNGRRRSAKGKRIEMNSMNYAGLIAESFFSKIPLNENYIQEDRRPITTLGAVWGLQRNYKGRFSLDFYLGAGYRFARSTIYTIPQPTTINTTTFALISQLNIGVWLNKRTP